MITAEFTEIPQPKTYGPLGNLPQLDLNAPSQSIMKLGAQYGPIFKVKFPTGTGIFVTSEELAKDVCDESRFDKLVNAPLKKVRSFSGDGLFTSWTKEENWKKAHNILLPAFSQSAMKGYHLMMVDIASQLIQKWARLNSDESIDVPEDMTRLTLDTIGLCGFNYRFNSFYREKPHRFIKSMARALDEAMHQSNRLGIQDKLMVKSRQQFNRDIEYMFSLVDRIIQERKASDEQDADDLLSRMLNCEDPATGEKLTDENIRYQIITFLIAGHETTSGLLSFALYFLMKHPDKLAKAYEEVDRVITGAVPTYQQVRNLKYIRMILNEALRLWPTAPIFSLYAKEDTVLAGKYAIKKRDVVNILNLNLHRDKQAWGDDVEEFRPERFEDPKRVPHFAFKPFGNGQRACIGQQFAMHEATLLIGMILKSFDLIDHTNYQLKIKETLTLKPDGLTMQVRPREQQESISFVIPGMVPAAQEEEKLPLHLQTTSFITHLTPLLVLYGSNLGTAEGIARNLAETGKAKGFQATCAPLDEFAGKLPKEGVIYIVTASYNGKPPKNARKFVKWLQENDDIDLSGLRYTVFGCGDTNWASTYQNIPNLIDEKFAEKGALRIAPKGQGDASSDFDRQVEDWNEQLWPTVIEALGLDLDLPLNQADEALTIQFLNEAPESASQENLPIMPFANPAPLVERALNRYGLEVNTQMVLNGSALEYHHLPLHFPVRAWDLLSYSVGLQETATPEQIKELAAYTVCPPHRKELEALLEEGPFTAHVSEEKVTMLDLLEKYPACEMPFERFIQLLTPLHTASTN
ncbi:cytochrome P450 [Neobacillus dielmonensis]|uniref:cytochrome P450 n=1 Tax=Neobacillus dielmonensis TaxID=1347369 RepID=UPI0009450888|nr:cytochrome P450 [Neobacillus dielmonensis]